MTYRVGPKGQVVIPKDVRERVGLEPGDEVNVYEDGGAVLIRKARSASALRGVLRGEDLVAALQAGRREERAREERKVAEWGVGRP